MLCPKRPQKLAGSHSRDFPKQTTGVCRRAGQLVNEELFSFASIEQKITDPGNFEKLMPVIEMQADRFLRIKLPAQMIIGMLVGERTLNEMKRCLAELKELFPVIMKNYMNGLQMEIDPARLVTEKISAFPAGKPEETFQKLVGTGREPGAESSGCRGWNRVLNRFITGIYTVLHLITDKIA
jgi:hypothetical protein